MHIPKVGEVESSAAAGWCNKVACGPPFCAAPLYATLSLALSLAARRNGLFGPIDDFSASVPVPLAGRKK